jgi:hypothetical protein
MHECWRRKTPNSIIPEWFEIQRISHFFSAFNRIFPIGQSTSLRLYYPSSGKGTLWVPEAAHGVATEGEASTWKG